MTVLDDRILLHLPDGRRIPIDPREVYYLKADGGETLGNRAGLTHSHILKCGPTTGQATSTGTAPKGPPA